MKIIYKTLGIATAIIVALIFSNLYAQEIDLSDGPHIYWTDDTTANLFYLCGDELIKETFIIAGDLIFKGRCHDSLTEYVIPHDRKLDGQVIYDGVSRIAAVSDIHGEYEYLENILQKSGVTDSDNRWIFGDGHLVIDGDIFDRGDKVTECLWLVYNLEHQAKKAGGKVHFLLGNHEKMVLRGDNRYVNEKYIDGIVKKMRIRHEDLYGADTELGRWLRNLNTAVKLNDVLFVHAGVPQFLLENKISIKELNDYMRSIISIDPVEINFEAKAKLYLGGDGPLWYRGFFEERKDHYPKASSAYIDSILVFYTAETIVVGHTGVDSIITMYDSKVIAIDIPFDELNGIELLLIENGEYFRIKVNGEKIKLR